MAEAAMDVAAQAAAPAQTDVGLSTVNLSSIQAKLDEFSNNDFMHDFWKTEFRIQQLLKDVSLNSKLSGPQRAKNVAKILIDVKNKATKVKRPVGAWNIAEHFEKDVLDTVFPDLREKRPGHTNEAKTINSILTGTTIESIKSHFRNADGTPNQTSPLTVNIILDDINRTYTVRAERVKYGTEKETLSKAFKKVAGDVSNKFALIVDASNLELTALSTLKTGDTAPDTPLEFYIVQSIENRSDSATKIKDIRSDNNTSVKFLQDPTQTKIFPAFPGTPDSKNTAAAYTKFNFEVTVNQNGEIDGVFKNGETPLLTIPNLSKNSKISHTVLKIMEEYIDNYNEYNSNNDVKTKICLHFPPKKFGDWCQGICATDLTRVYTILNQSEDLPSTISLSEIQSDGEVAVLTLDQILLAFSLLLGVNVYFTIKYKGQGGSDDDTHGDVWLYYFKNTKTDNSTFTDAQTEEIKTQLEALVPRITELNSFISTNPKFTSVREPLNGAPLDNLLTFLTELKKKSKILSSIRLDSINALSTEATNMITYAGSDERKYKNKLDIDALTKKFEDLSGNYRSILADGYTPFTAEDNELIGEIPNIINSKTIFADTTVLSRFLNTILYPIRDDIGPVQLINGKFTEYTLDPPVEGGRRVSYLGTIKLNKMKLISTLNTVFLNNIAMRGGTKLANTAEARDDQLKKAFDDIRLRTIFSIKTKFAYQQKTHIKNTTARCGKYRLNALEIGKKIKKEIEKEEEKIEIEIEKEEEKSKNIYTLAAEINSDNKDIYEKPYITALVESYVIDRNGNYCSVLDDYIITIDECDVFLSVLNDACTLIKGETEPINLVGNNLKIRNEFNNNASRNHEHSIMYRYLYLRFILLWHDILYTKYKEVEADYYDILASATAEANAAEVAADVAAAAAAAAEANADKVAGVAANAAIDAKIRAIVADANANNAAEVAFESDANPASADAAIDAKIHAIVAASNADDAAEAAFESDANPAATAAATAAHANAARAYATSVAGSTEITYSSTDYQDLRKRIETLCKFIIDSSPNAKGRLGYLIQTIELQITPGHRTYKNTLLSLKRLLHLIRCAIFNAYWTRIYKKKNTLQHDISEYVKNERTKQEPIILDEIKKEESEGKEEEDINNGLLNEFEEKEEYITNILPLLMAVDKMFVTTHPTETELNAAAGGKRRKTRRRKLQQGRKTRRRA